MRKQMISARVDGAALAALRSLADRNRLTHTDVIEQAIREYVELHRNDTLVRTQRIVAVPKKETNQP